MQQTIPFSPFPLPLIRVISRPFMGFGNIVSKSFPFLEIELMQSGLKLDSEEYGAIMFVVGLFWFIAGGAVAGLVAYRIMPDSLLPISLGAGALIFFTVFLQLSVYPKLMVRKKVRDVERNLIFALRTIFVQIKSGVSLFYALTMIAKGQYGGVSREFSRAVDEINAGIAEEDSLQKLAISTPSLFFRRVIWQLVNALRAGADIGDVLKSMISTMTKQETIEIRKYGSALRMLSLIYMMLGVIVPALGLTLLIILGSFPQINISEWMFWGMLSMLIVAQFMYLGLIKSKRPNLVGG